MFLERDGVRLDLNSLSQYRYPEREILIDQHEIEGYLKREDCMEVIYFLFLTDFLNRNFYVNESLNCRMKVVQWGEIDSGMI